jgi:replication fork protection complex subunit Csm3/Swi3
MYQLWLDDLYPRAKFADALTIVEKLGHSKRMHMMRKQWIDEGRPKPDSGERHDDGASLMTTAADGQQHTHQTEDLPAGEIAPLSPADDAALASEQMRHEQHDPASDLLVFSQTEQQPGRRGDEAPIHGHSLADGEPDMDELDALLEQDTTAYGRIQEGAKARPGPALPEQDEFADEMEAMAGMEDPW